MEKELEFKGETSMSELPEGCITDIVSLTTPLDACKLSLVSKSFCSAAESDKVWDRFLPSDLSSIISNDLLKSSSPFLHHHANPSKKSLYLVLSDHPLIIDNGKKSFQLEKETGKKCYMLSARSLSIVWGDTPRYWNWITIPESRFPEVAMLRAVWWFEIRGKMNTLLLSSNTRYAAFLVFKLMDDALGFHHDPTELSIGRVGGEMYTKSVWFELENPNNEENDQLERPKARSDGWLEIEMGEFFNLGLEDEEEVEMSVLEIKGNYKNGFLLEGIEIRPKK